MSLVRSLAFTIVALACMIAMAAAPGWFVNPTFGIEEQVKVTPTLVDGAPRYFEVGGSAPARAVLASSLAPQRTTRLFPAVKARSRYAHPDVVLAQLPRVAAERGMDEAMVSALVQRYTERMPLGPITGPAVNVPMLNLALDALP